MELDIQKIKEDFIKVIRYSQGIEEPKVDELFDIWFDKKKYFFKAFGEKLIYEMPNKVTFKLSEENKKIRLQGFINMCWDSGLSKLSSFLEDQRDGFYKNICEKDYKNIVKKGTKLVKAFKYFVDEPDVLSDIQNKASQIIQENKVEGTICFSIHPLDYLSISENVHNWRSCHALDGEYRAGNLSYMMDSNTIVCYLKADGEYKLPNFPEDVLWNSKKWRVLLYVSEDKNMIFAGKQYPFTNMDGMSMILEEYFNFGKGKKFNHFKLRDENCYWLPWTDYKIDELNIDNVVYSWCKTYIPLGDCVIALKDLVKNAPGSKQFNDVLRSSCYIPIYTQRVLPSWWDDSNKRYPCTDSRETTFEIGAMTYCLRCGKNEVMDDGADTMMCYDCERVYGQSENDNFAFCNHCGCRIETNNGFWLNESYYCEECFNRFAIKCDDCQDYYLEEDMVETEDGSVYCRWCYDNKEHRNKYDIW